MQCVRVDDRAFDIQAAPGSLIEDPTLSVISWASSAILPGRLVRLERTPNGAEQDRVWASEPCSPMIGARQGRRSEARARGAGHC